MLSKIPKESTTMIKLLQKARASGFSNTSTNLLDRRLVNAKGLASIRASEDLKNENQKQNSIKTTRSRYSVWGTDFDGYGYG